MGGAGFSESGHNKIKGGRWTVVKFFFVSVGYTCVWMAQCSELGTYRALYGPSVLLKMNIMYYLPSIPLLAVSSAVDEPLDNYFGVAKTVLMRLIIGMGGCFLIAIVFPLEPNRLGLLLGTIACLGLAHGVSFSASYQLVSRFANKNTIALGLGCVGSGGLVLGFELVLRMGTNPSTEDEALLYGTCAALVLLGMASAVSLLIRHWRSIEAAAAPGEAALQQKASLDPALVPLLLPQPEEAPLVAAELAEVASGSAGFPEDDSATPSGGQPASPQQPPQSQPLALAREGSLQALLALSPLDFFKSVSDGDSTLLLGKNAFQASSPLGRVSGGSPTSTDDDLWRASVLAEQGGLRWGPSRDRSAHGGSQYSLRGSSPRAEAFSPVAAPSASPFAGAGTAGGSGSGGRQHAGGAPGVEQQLQQQQQQQQSTASSPRKAAGSPAWQQQADARAFSRATSAMSVGSITSAAGQQVERASANARDTMRRMWAIQAALFTSGTIGLLIFPFITYVPSSGALGDMLPKWLFFVRLFADLAGRLLPRAKRLALPNQVAVLMLALVMLALSPLFYLYIALSPPWFHSDTLACVYIACMWILNGYVNTNAYVLAPKAVLPTQKATAAGILAVTYQGAHVCGLLLGTVICYLVFTGF